MSGEEQSSQYHRAGKFSGEREAGSVYFSLQRLFDSPEADLSAYRCQIQGVWHVAVVGDAPHEELADELEKWLSAGESVDLPDDVLEFLHRRRAVQVKHGPWVGGHFWPGLRLWFGP